MKRLLVLLILLSADFSARAWPVGTPQPDKYVLPPASADVRKEAAEARQRLGNVDLTARLVGHRGDCSEQPENTEHAFRKAVDGNFGFEADLWMTRDGQLVATHDVYLFREGVRTKGWVTNAVWKGDLELSDAGVWYGSKWRGTRFPMIDDVLTLAKDGRFVVLHVCDARCREVLPKVAEAVRRHPNVNSKNLIIQADMDLVDEYLPGYRGVAPMLPRKGWLITDPPNDLYQWTDKVPLKTRPYLSVRWDEELITKRYVDYAHAKGFKVMVWTVNDAASAWTALGRGVDWVLTDRAAALAREMKRFVGTEPVKLPGEPCTKAPLPCFPFPDRLSAFVWRNWNLVSVERLAAIVGTVPAELERIAADMGLGSSAPVLPEWRRKGYITILRRNWHLLPYEQLTEMVDMTREKLAFSLTEDDFLWVKLGRLKPKCEPLVFDKAEVTKTKAERRKIAETLKAEGVDPCAPEEPRFSFITPLSQADGTTVTRPTGESSFDFRLIFSYFADYGDPLGDSEIKSYPEGLLQKLAAQGVNAVWLHSVLRTLAKDPKYPEWGEGSERRIVNLRKLVARAAKYGIKVYLYMNEPRGMDDAFFKADPKREAFRGALSDDIDIHALCPSDAEPLRWLSDSLAQVFGQVPGLGGIFTITMSENMTHCKARTSPRPCARCRDRSAGDIIAAVNRAMVEGMRRGNPEAEAILYTWKWPDAEVPEIMAKLPKSGCRIMTVSEDGMRFVRGGVEGMERDYAISVVGPGEPALGMWRRAAEAGLPCVAKVQVANSWELSTFPYLPVDELNARQAVNLANAGVRGVMLSWSCGCYPAPNLAVYGELRLGERTPGPLLDRLAESRYGVANVARVRRAWQAFADGFVEFPFDIEVVYNGPQHWGVANPLYLEKTGYAATMVGIPYDDVKGWCAQYPPTVFASQMRKVARGFAAGCRELEGVAGTRELNMFKAEQLHFESSADQVRFVLARESGDAAAMSRIAARELARARAQLPWVRADSRIGYESSNHYFFLPRDLMEKVLCCRRILSALSSCEEQKR